MPTASPNFYAVEELLEPAEMEIRDRVRAFCDREVLPRINDFWERGGVPRRAGAKIAELGISGGSVEGHGSPGMSPVAAGLGQPVRLNGTAGAS